MHHGWCYQWLTTTWLIMYFVEKYRSQHGPLAHSAMLRGGGGGDQIATYPRYHSGFRPNSWGKCKQVQAFHLSTLIKAKSGPTKLSSAVFPLCTCRLLLPAACCQNPFCYPTPLHPTTGHEALHLGDRYLCLAFLGLQIGAPNKCKLPFVPFPTQRLCGTPSFNRKRFTDGNDFKKPQVEDHFMDALHQAWGGGGGGGCFLPHEKEIVECGSFPLRETNAPRIALRVHRALVFGSRLWIFGRFSGWQGRGGLRG